MKKSLLMLTGLAVLCLLVSCSDPHEPSDSTPDQTTSAEVTISETPDSSIQEPTEAEPAESSEPATEVLTEPVTEPVTETVTEPVTEAPTEAQTETPTTPVTDAPGDPDDPDHPEDTEPMPATVREALTTYTDILHSTVVSYSRKLQNVTVERVMTAIERIERASEFFGATNQGGYYLAIEDNNVYLRRKITYPVDNGAEEGSQILSEFLGESS